MKVTSLARDFPELKGLRIRGDVTYAHPTLTSSLLVATVGRQNTRLRVKSQNHLGKRSLKSPSPAINFILNH